MRPRLVQRWTLTRKSDSMPAPSVATLREAALCCEDGGEASEGMFLTVETKELLEVCEENGDMFLVRVWNRPLAKINKSKLGQILSVVIHTDVNQLRRCIFNQS